MKIWQNTKVIFGANFLFTKLCIHPLLGKTYRIEEILQQFVIINYGLEKVLSKY
jgi:hypothetical protein